MPYSTIDAHEHCAMACDAPPRAALLTASGTVHLCLDHLAEVIFSGQLTYPVLDVVGSALQPGSVPRSEAVPRLRLVNRG
jgi:hypothetical protein